MVNPNKTTCTLATPDLEEYSTKLHLPIDTMLLMNTPPPPPNILAVTLYPKLTYTTYIVNKCTQTTINHKSTTRNSMDKQKEMITATHKAVVQPTLECSQLSSTSERTPQTVIHFRLNS